MTIDENSPRRHCFGAKQQSQAKGAWYHHVAAMVKARHRPGLCESTRPSRRGELQRQLTDADPSTPPQAASYTDPGPIMNLDDRTEPLASRKPIGLALQGGGSWGAYTWGVLDAVLASRSIRIAQLSGTSAGAINAAIVA